MQSNPILQMLTSSASQIMPNNIMMQAVLAMIRGESAQSFLQNLAKNSPELQDMDLSNPYQAAEKLYSDKNQDITQAKATIRDRLNAFLSK